jgi:hypothetical protein
MWRGTRPLWQQRIAWATLLAGLLVGIGISGAVHPWLRTRGLPLLLGSLSLGALAGVLVAWLFGLPQRRAVLCFVLAVPLSLLAGHVAAGKVHSCAMAGAFGPGAFYALRRVLLVAGAVGVAVSVLVAWAFCFGILRGRARRFAKSLVATVIAMGLAYTALTPVWLASSSVSVLTELELDPSAASEVPPIATVYYVGGDGHELRSVRIDGAGGRRVTWSAMIPHGRIGFLRQRPFVIGDISVETFWARPDDRSAWGGWRGQQSPVIEALPLEYPVPVHAAAAPYVFDLHDLPGGAFPLLAYSSSVTSRKAPSYWKQRYCPWEAEAGGLAGPGVRARGLAGQGEMRLSLDLPFVRWHAASPVLLPGGLLVCQFGPQIVLIDLERRRMARLAVGSQPLVVLDTSALRRPTPRESPGRELAGAGDEVPLHREPVR